MLACKKKLITSTAIVAVFVMTSTFAQTPDGDTPAVENVCLEAGLTGKLYGLCNAYCEAMDCDSETPQASERACDRVYNKIISELPGVDAFPDCTDIDGDGIPNGLDNSPYTPNPDQTDSDGDGIGDASDPVWCGNSVPNDGEQCDDGNDSNIDGCTNDCKLASCGDLYTQPGLGEACDDGNSINTDDCTNDCKLPACGDGIVSDSEDFECENLTDPTGLPSICDPLSCKIISSCGDGVISGAEECDINDPLSALNCSEECLCSVSHCGPEADVSVAQSCTHTEKPENIKDEYDCNISICNSSSEFHSTNVNIVHSTSDGSVLSTTQHPGYDEVQCTISEDTRSTECTIPSLDTLTCFDFDVHGEIDHTAYQDFGRDLFYFDTVATTHGTFDPALDNNSSTQSDFFSYKGSIAINFNDASCQFDRFVIQGSGVEDMDSLWYHCNLTFENTAFQRYDSFIASISLSSPPGTNSDIQFAQGGADHVPLTPLFFCHDVFSSTFRRCRIPFVVGSSVINYEFNAFETINVEFEVLVRRDFNGSAAFALDIEAYATPSSSGYFISEEAEVYQEFGYVNTD